MRYRLYYYLPTLIALLIALQANAQTGILRVTGQSRDICGKCDTPSPNGGTNTGSIFITVTGGSPAYFYTWSNGNSTQNLNTVCGGTYTVTVTDSRGATATGSFIVREVPNFPIVINSSNTAPCNFDSTKIARCEKVCPFTTVTYSAPNSGGGLQGNGVFWQVNGAASFTVNYITGTTTVTWGAPGVGDVSAFMEDSLCFRGGSRCVTIVEAPKAKFKTDPATTGDTVKVCLGQVTYFDNLSTGANRYEWLFGDVFSTEEAASTSHIFRTPGIYPVRLVAASDCLCSDTTILYVRVLDAKAPTLDCVGTVCPGTSVTYTASGSCPPFAWAVSANGAILNGGTAQSDSITVQWNNGPAGTLQLLGKACSGAECPLPARVRVPIVDDNAQIKGKTGVCPNSTETYTIEPFGGTGFVWQLVGNGQIIEGQGTNSITVSWGEPANPTKANWLIVEYTNCYLGCAGRDSMDVRILAPFSLSGPVERCEKGSAPFASRLAGSLQNLNCNWTLYAPNGNAVWNTAAPSANPTLVFDNGPGLYRIVAIPADPSQTCSDRADWSVQVAALPAKPTRIAGERLICPNQPYTYEALGLPTGADVQWSIWNAANNPFSAKGNPYNITWSNGSPRRLAVSQVSTDGLGCLSDTVMMTIQALTAPTITGPVKVCEDATGQYAIQPRPNLDIQWRVIPASAGAIAEGQGTANATVFWTQTGTHTLEVTVCGLKSTLSVQVPALPAPIVQKPAGVCPGQTLPVQTTVPYSSYLWETASGTLIASTASPSLGQGSYVLSVTDANGCTGNAEFTIDSFPTPNLTVTTADPTGFCNNSRFVKIDALVPQAGDYTYQWFKDGQPMPGETGQTLVTNQYGLYSAEVVNTYGCPASDGPILVFEYCIGSGVCHNPKLKPRCNPGDMAFDIFPTASCDSFGFKLNPGPQYVPGSVEWSFGESGSVLLGTSTEEAPQFKFPNAGHYIIIMQATLDNGAICTLLDSVRVEAAAKFTSTPACAGSMTQYQDASTFLPDGGISQWTWDFGDPASGASNGSNQVDPDHRFNTNGDYDVRLTVTALTGCTATIVRKSAIPGGTPAVFPLPSARCAGNATAFEGIVLPDISEVRWNFGEPATGAANDARGAKSYHHFNTPGTYTVTTTTKNAYGCTASFTQNVAIRPNPLNGTISPANPLPICEGKTQALNAPAGGVAWQWSEGSTGSPTLTVSKEGTYRVTITDANGCTYAPPPVRIEVNPAPKGLIKALLKNEQGQTIGTSYPSLAACHGDPVYLKATGSGLYSYTWTGNNGNNDEISFTPERGNALPEGTHVYSVTIRDGLGCTAVSTPFTVVINPVPSGFSISGDGACAGSPVTLRYNGPNNPNWELLWNTGDKGPTLTTQAAGLFHVRALNEFGCSAKSNDWQILRGPAAGNLPSGCHKRCKPDTLCMNVGIPNIASWQWFFEGQPLAGATAPVLVAQQSGTYWAELTDFSGCKAKSDPLSLQLYDGFGDLEGKVWSDVNNNGAIDAADTLVSNIGVRLLLNGQPSGQAQSNTSGAFFFPNIRATDYVVSVNTGQLPTGWRTVIGQANVTLSGCNDRETCGLLLRFDCAPVTTTIALAGCPNDSVLYRNVFIQTGTSKTFDFKTALGCDSTVTVRVNPLATSASDFDAFACAGGTFTYQGMSLAIGATQVFHLKNRWGCDSAVTVRVFPMPPLRHELVARVCPGEVFEYEGISLLPGDVKEVAFKTPAGCDSLVTVRVLGATRSDSTLSVRICAGASYEYYGVTLRPGDVQIFDLQNWQGCDSLVKVSVSALPPLQGTLNARVCAGTVFQYGGTTLAPGTSQLFYLRTAAGCDSVLTVSVAEVPHTTASLKAKVCPGESFAYQGFLVPAGTSQVFQLTNWLGCDSTVTVSVEALPLIPPTFLEQKVCRDSAFRYQGQRIAPGETRTFIFTTPEGCDSTVTVAVSALPTPTFAVAAERSCPNTPTGTINAFGVSGSPQPYQYALDKGAFQNNPHFEGLAAGNYRVWVRDSNACVAWRDTQIAERPPLRVALSDALLPCDSPNVRLDAQVEGDLEGLSYRWWNGATTPFTFATSGGPVWIEVQNTCETQRKAAEVRWDASDVVGDLVYVPNCFAPDKADEPVNAIFMPSFMPSVEVLAYKLEVYDRWGNLMFRSQAVDSGWEGHFREEDMKPGVYVWLLDATINFCGRDVVLSRKGDVTVVR